MPDGADWLDYLPRVSSGDTLKFAASGTYAGFVSSTAMDGIVSGTSAKHTKIDGNGASIVGGAYGLVFNSKSFIDVLNLNLIDNTTNHIAVAISDDISFTNVSVSSGTGVLLDAWKIKDADRITINGGASTLLAPSATLTCDGVEFWGPCNDCTVTNHTATGYDNGSGDDDGHGFEVYGESPAEICDNINFVSCVAIDCQAGFSCEGGPSSNAVHTNVLCTSCSGSGNDLADFRGVEGATLYRTLSPGTTDGTVTDV